MATKGPLKSCGVGIPRLFWLFRSTAALRCVFMAVSGPEPESTSRDNKRGECWRACVLACVPLSVIDGCGGDEDEGVEKLTGWRLAALAPQTWIPSQMGQHKVRLLWGEHHCKVEEDGQVKLDETFTLQSDAGQRKMLMAGRTFEETVEDPSRRSQFSFEGGRSACTFLAVEAAAHLIKRLVGAAAGCCVVPGDIELVLDRGMRRYLEEGGKDSLAAMGLEHANVAEVSCPLSSPSSHVALLHHPIALSSILCCFFYWQYLKVGGCSFCVSFLFSVTAHAPGSHQIQTQAQAHKDDDCTAFQRCVPALRIITTHKHKHKCRHKRV